MRNWAERCSKLLLLHQVKCTFKLKICWQRGCCRADCSEREAAAMGEPLHQDFVTVAVTTMEGFGVSHMPYLFRCMLNDNERPGIYCPWCNTSSLKTPLSLKRYDFISVMKKYSLVAWICMFIYISVLRYGIVFLSFRNIVSKKGC